MNVLDIVTTANRNLIKNKVRTALTLLAIIIGAVTLGLTVGITSGVSNYINQQVSSVGTKNMLFIQPKIDLGIGSGPKKYEENKVVITGDAARYAGLTDTDIVKIEAVKQLTKVQPLITLSPKFGYGPNNEKYVMQLQSFMEGSSYTLIAGRHINSQSEVFEISLPKQFVTPLGFASPEEAVGKTVSLVFMMQGAELPQTATIVGVQQSSLLNSNNAIDTNPVFLRKLYDQSYNAIPVELRPKYAAATGYLPKEYTQNTLNAVKAELTQLNYNGVTLDEQIGQVKNVIRGIMGVLIFFGAIALLAASFGIINTLYMSVQERTKEIGLMKALGMSKGKIFSLFSAEAILIGFWGSIIGLTIAYILGKIANRVVSEKFLQNLPGFNITEFYWPYLLGISLLIMAIAFLAGTLPARRASKLDPIDALRYE